MGDRVRLRLGGAEPVLIGGRRWYHDFTDRRAQASGPRPGSAHRTLVHGHGGSDAVAHRSEILRVGTEARPAPLVSLFAP